MTFDKVTGGTLLSNFMFQWQLPKTENGSDTIWNNIDLAHKSAVSLEIDNMMGGDGRMQTSSPTHNSGSKPMLVIGDDSDEIIRGGHHHDELYGGAGDDKLRGGEGKDYLSGNQGIDRLWGGKGADTFAFDGNYDRQIVHDFDAKKGDNLQFIFYTPDQAALADQDILDMFYQRGDHAMMRIGGTNEKVILRNTDIESLNVDNISVMIIDV